MSIYVAQCWQDALIDLRLIREAKVHAKRRVHIALNLAFLDKLVRVAIQKLNVVGVEIDELLVLLNALRRHRFGENGAATGDFTTSAY